MTKHLYIDVQEIVFLSMHYMYIVGYLKQFVIILCLISSLNLLTSLPAFATDIVIDSPINTTDTSCGGDVYTGQGSCSNTSGDTITNNSVIDINLNTYTNYIMAIFHTAANNGNFSSTLTNSTTGTISVSSTTSSATYGMFLTHDIGALTGTRTAKITNHGKINVHNTAPDGWSFGMGATTSNTSAILHATLENYGTIDAYSAGTDNRAAGISATSNGLGSWSSFLNQGKMTAEATGNNSWAHGFTALLSGEDNQNIMINGTAGQITAKIDGINTGMVAGGMYTRLSGRNAHSSMENYGTIESTAAGENGTIYGLRMELTNTSPDGTSTMDNHGTINSIITGDGTSLTRSNRANGIYLQNQGNNNTITATNQGIINNTVYGAYGLANGFLIDSQGVRTTIELTNETGASILSNVTGANAQSHGIWADLSGAGSNGTFINRGSIETDASGTGDVQAHAIRINLYGTDTTAALQNDGIIRTLATGNAWAYGLRTTLNNSSNVAHIANTGLIQARSQYGGSANAIEALTFANGSTAYVTNTGKFDLYSDSGTMHQLLAMGCDYGAANSSCTDPALTGQGGTVHINDWNVTMRSYDLRMRPFAVNYNATLNFDDAHFNVTRGTPAQGFYYDTVYPIRDMVAMTNGTPDNQVSGRIIGATLVNALPGEELEILNAAQGQGDTVDRGQALRIRFDPKAGPGSVSSITQSAIMQAQISRITAILAATSPRCIDLVVSGTDGGKNDVSCATPRHSSFQLRPYYGYFSRRGLGASQTDATGVLLLGTYQTEDGHSLGAHFGVEFSGSNTSDRSLKIHSTTGVVGTQGRYQITPAAYLRGQISGILSSNKNRFSTLDGALSAEDTGISFGAHSSIDVGYDARIASGNIITPEVGLSTTFSHIPSANLQYADPTLNQFFYSQNRTTLQGHTSLRWTGTIDFSGTTISPTVMAGIRQTLSGNRIHSDVTLNGQRFTSSFDDDWTTGIVQVGAETRLSDNTNLSLTYHAEQSQRTSNHMGYLNLRIRF